MLAEELMFENHTAEGLRILLDTIFRDLKGVRSKVFITYTYISVLTTQMRMLSHSLDYERQSSAWGVARGFSRALILHARTGGPGETAYLMNKVCISLSVRLTI